MPENWTHAARTASLAVAAALMLGGCPELDIGPGEEARNAAGAGPATRTADVRASDWVRRSTAIDGYAVADGDPVAITLLGAGGRPLARMDVRVLSDAGDAATDGALEARLRRDDDTRLTLRTNGVAERNGYTTVMRLSDDRGHRVGLRAEHRYGSCYDDDRVPGSGAPVCAAPLSLADAAYSLPSCGQPRFGFERAGLGVPLRSLTYIQDQPAALPNRGAKRWRNGNAFQARLRVYTDGRTLPAAQVADWLAATGADAIIGTDAEQLLTAAFQDPAWRDFLAEQRAADATEGPFRLAAIVAGGPTTANACAARRGIGASSALARASQCSETPPWLDNLGGLFGASAQGDPHLITHDRMAYDFQGAGEYVLARSDDGSFELQGRLEPLPGNRSPVCSAVTYVTAVAMRLYGTRVGLYVRDGSGLDLRAAGMDIPDTAAALASALPAGLVLESEDGHYAFVLDDGDRITVRRRFNTLAVDLRVAPARRGRVAGLFGTPTGDSDDDFQQADGTTLTASPSFDGLYGGFGDSWRVTDASQSLFDYAAGSGPADYNLAGFPDRPARVSQLDPAVRADAEARCAKVEGEPQHTWCVLDTACTGDSFAEVYRGMATPPARLAPGERPLIVTGALRLGAPDSVAADDQAELPATCRIPGPTDNAVFAERLGHTLAGAVTVGATAPGEYDAPGDLTPASIAMGRTVDVYFIHVPERVRVVPQTGSVRFAGEILGVAASDASLADSDDLSNAGLTYPAPGTAGRALELGTDRFRISPDARELRLDLGGPGDVDQLRVFVATP